MDPGREKPRVSSGRNLHPLGVFPCRWFQPLRIFPAGRCTETRKLRYNQLARKPIGVGSSRAFPPDLRLRSNTFPFGPVIAHGCPEGRPLRAFGDGAVNPEGFTVCPPPADRRPHPKVVSAGRPAVPLPGPDSDPEAGPSARRLLVSRFAGCELPRFQQQEK